MFVPESASSSGVGVFVPESASSSGVGVFVPESASELTGGESVASSGMVRLFDCGAGSTFVSASGTSEHEGTSI